MPLDDIKNIMGRRSFDVLSALESHKEKLNKRIGQMQRLINTVDDTILYLKEKKEMSNKQLFEPFNEACQAEFEKEAMQMYDPEMVKVSNQKWKSYTKEEKQRIGEEGNAAYLAIVAAIPSRIGKGAGRCGSVAQAYGLLLDSCPGPAAWTGAIV